MPAIPANHRKPLTILTSPLRTKYRGGLAYGIILSMNKIITTDVYGKKYEVPIEKLTPSVHVYGIIVKDGKALISPQYDGYDWPGGTFKLGEDTVATLKREVKEETGYDVEPVKLLGIYTSFFHHVKRNQDYQSLLVFYLAKIVGGELSDEGFDNDEKEYAKLARWVEIGELRKMRHACNLNIADELLGFIEAGA